MQLTDTDSGFARLGERLHSLERGLVGWTGLAAWRARIATERA